MSLEGNWRKDAHGEYGRLGEISRRRFVAMSGMGAAALIFGAGPFTEEALAQPKLSGYPFRLGVASGDPEPDGVVIWTRLAPKPLAENGRGGMPRASVPVRWEVATDERFRRVVQNGRINATPELGHSVHVEVEGLRPGREYFYRFEAAGEISPVGRTKTAPALGSPLGEMTFAFASCQAWEAGYYNAYARMAEEDLDVVFHLGDYIYEGGVGSSAVRPHNSTEIRDLSDYRNRHALYKTDRDLRSAHAAFPFIVTWDDHEVENNYADDIPQVGESPEAFLQRRAAAYQAYYEHQPLRRGSVPRGPDMQLYRRIAYGNLAEFNVLDTRQYRDDQANGDGAKAPNEISRDPNRTLTGSQQERWLLNGLSGSDATWNVLSQQVFFSRQDVDTGDGLIYNMDAWDGYEPQRDRIVDYMEARNVSNPVVLTGDVHANWANDIKADFDDPESPVVGTEFVGTSIASGGDGSDVREDTAGILAENPHIKFFNNQRGYVRCTLTPETWQADYRVVPYVTQPGARVFTRASFVVRNGQPGLQQITDNNIPVTREVAPQTEIQRITADLNTSR